MQPNVALLAIKAAAGHTKCGISGRAPNGRGRAVAARCAAQGAALRLDERLPTRPLRRASSTVPQLMRWGSLWVMAAWGRLETALHTNLFVTWTIFRRCWISNLGQKWTHSNTSFGRLYHSKLFDDCPQAQAILHGYFSAVFSGRCCERAMPELVKFHWLFSNHTVPLETQWNISENQYNLTKSQWNFTKSQQNFTDFSVKLHWFSVKHGCIS